MKIGNLNNLKKILRYNFVVAAETVSYIIFLLPRFSFLDFVKSCYLRIFWGATIGKRVIYYPGVWVFTGSNLIVGDDVDFAKDVIITTGGGVIIGDRVLIGYRTQILSSNHRVPDDRSNIFNAGHVHKPIKISDDVWIGSNCIILPGVTIGRGSVVAAGTVVAKDVPDYVYVAGYPARLLKER